MEKKPEILRKPGIIYTDSSLHFCFQKGLEIARPAQILFDCERHSDHINPEILELKRQLLHRNSPGILRLKEEWIPQNLTIKSFKKRYE